MSKLRVWIDQDLCTGDGLCVEITPALFDMHDDGLAYVKEENWPDIYAGSSTHDPVYKMATGTANVPEHLAESAIESAEDCPGECIFFNVVE